ncbi:hypothetical protein [Flavobacterium cerinum]|nr:hypothetical protein [Flavobacterium cerinum]
MRLLLLLPNLLLLAISGHNLSVDFFNPETKAGIVVTLMHLFVMALCLLFIGLIIKSLFSIKYIEEPENSSEQEKKYGEFNLQHSS